MSPLSNFAVVAFAASAMAIPQAGYGGWGHGHGHSHLHSASAVSAASAASRYSGSVRPYGSSGSVRPTKSHSSSAGAAVPTLSEYAPAGHNAAPSGGEEGASSAAASSQGAAVTGANAGATSDCDEVTVTATDLVTVYVTASSGGVASGGSGVTTTITVQSTSHVTLSTTVTGSSPAAAAASSSSSAISSSSSSSATADAAAASSIAQQSVANHYNPAGGASGGWGDHGGWPKPSSTDAAPVASSSSSSSSSSPGPPAAAPTPSTSSSEVASPAATSPTSTSTPPPAPATTSTTAAFSIGLPSVSIPNIFSSTSSSAPAASPSTYTPPAGKSGNPGKRGLAYNDASFTNCFDGASQVSWAYNWASSGTVSVPGVEYIPLLWGTGSDFTGQWLVNAKKAIAAGSKTVFSFNEPDISSQANLAPAVAAAAYKTFMMPLANQGAKLCAPAVTNGGGAMGLNWLQSFLDACKPLGCQIDCLNIHWYDSPENVAYFKSHVQQAISMGAGVPVYVSEFGVNSDSYSTDQVSSFLQQVMPWMDSQDSVAGYAYYKVDPSDNTHYPLTTNGGDASALGKIYMTYTG